MKILSSLISGNPIEAGLNLANTVGQVVLAALPSTEQRTLLIKLHTAAILARTNLRATKLQKREALVKIHAIRKSLRLSVRFNLKDNIPVLNEKLEAVLLELAGI